MAKHRIVKKTLWVASSQGKPSGYGETPLSAHRDADRRQLTALNNAAQIRALKKPVDDLTASIRGQLNDHKSRLEKAETFSLALKKEFELLKAEHTVLMACVKFSDPDPYMGVAKLQDERARVKADCRELAIASGPIEITQAAGRVSKMLHSWRAVLDREAR